MLSRGARSSLSRRTLQHLHSSNHRPANPFKRQRVDLLRSAVQRRSLSLWGWPSSKQASDEFAHTHTNPSPAPPTQNVNDSSVVYQPAAPETARTVKASLSTSDAPDPSIPLQDSPPYTHEPKAIHDLENLIALPSSPESSLPSPEVLQSVPETLGYLHSIGLDYGWGITTVNQWVLEHLHISAGLSWAASIFCLALLVRVIVIPLTSRSSDQSARLQLVNPELKVLQAQAKAAAEKRDQIQMMQARQQIKDLFAEHNIKMTRVFMPILVQIPLQFSAFRLLRAMSALPVPALETEDWLWTTNLTLGDPLYIIPVLSSAMIYGAIRFASPEMGATGGQGAAEDMKKILRVAMPVGNFAFMCFMPGCVQIYFATTTMLAMGQSWLMMNPTTRGWLGLYPFPKPSPPAAAGPDGSQSRVLSTTGRVVEEDQSDRSAIDKGVDWMKDRFEGQRKGLSNLTSAAFGSKEERERKQRTERATVYEARRQRELEDQRRLDADGSRPDVPAEKTRGALRKTVPPATLEDPFEADDEISDAEKRQRQKAAGKRKVHR